jgi:hypothetical protein
LKEYDVNLEVLFASTKGAWNYVGGSATKQLVTSTCGGEFRIDMDTDEYFVVTKVNGKEAESAVLKLTKVHNTDGVTIKDYSGNVVAENKKHGKTFDAADMTITVNGYNQSDSNATFTIATSQNCLNATLITKEGLMIGLPKNTFVNNFTGNLQALTNYSYIFNITQEDKDENIGVGSFFQINATWNADPDANVKLGSAPSAKDILSGNNTFSVDDTKVYVGRINGTLASKITEDKVADQNSIEIEYPGEETYGNLFIGSKASKVTTSASGESVAVSKIEVGAAVLDSSLASYTSQNLIVVGGPAINKASAALLGKKYPAYGAESGIPENAGLIKLVEQADGTVAMIVAGWEAEDTQRACRVVAESDQYAMSGKEVQVTGTSMTDITVGVPATA